MDVQAILKTLSSLPALQVATGSGRLSVFVPAVNDRVHLEASDVERCRKIRSPLGEPAVQFVVRIGSVESPLILTNDDVVFTPEEPDSQLDCDISFEVGNGPPLVAYSEMERDLLGFASQCQEDDNLDQLAGTFLLFRCFIMGAARFGMKPVRATAAWQHAWQAVGGAEAVPLPPFRALRTWDALAQAAAELPFESDR